MRSFQWLNEVLNIRSILNIKSEYWIPAYIFISCLFALFVCLHYLYVAAAICRVFFYILQIIRHTCVMCVCLLEVWFKYCIGNTDLEKTVTKILDLILSSYSHIIQYNSIYLIHYFSIISLRFNIQHLFLVFTVAPPKSNYWRYFIKVNEGGKCNICQQIIKTSGNTTNLRFHLMRTHPKIHLQMKSNRTEDTNDTATESSSSTKQRKLMVRNILFLFHYAKQLKYFFGNINL